MTPSWERPWRLSATLHGRPWGGSRLKRWTREHPPAGTPFGEAWLVGPDERVQGGADHGTTLEALAQRDNGRWLGGYASGASFPLLIKILDAAQTLSIQVHPNDAAAQASGHARGKTEAWWVLEAELGSTVYWGVNAPLTREALAVAVKQGSLPRLLRQLPIAVGDVVVNAAGTIHALGAGVLAYEVQQASDVTYRLDDFGRLDADGKPRTLHHAEGVAVALLEPGDSPAPVPLPVAEGRVELARTHAFVLEGVSARASWTVEPSSFEILTNLGSARDAWVAHQHGSERLAPGESLVWPAGSGKLHVVDGERLGRVRLPEPARDAGTNRVRLYAKPVAEP
jgi:mannose-6-phosphate isomerase